MNELHSLDKFQQVLESYVLSAAAQKTLSRLKLTLLVAPSSSGRNTIIRELLKTGKYHFIVSDTTRQPRRNDAVLERNGRDYWFRTESEVLRDLQAGEFLEAAIIHAQQVSGISIRELEKACQDDKVAINDVEVVGADNIHRAKPDTNVIFVVPPSFDVWIKRLHHRGALPEDEVRRRLQSALREFAAALGRDYYKFVVNDQLEEAVAKVYALSCLGRVDAAEQALARAVIEAVYHDAQTYLAS